MKVPALLSLADAAFGYGGRPVISGVDLEVGPGAFVAVLGPNGSGKTTLVRGAIGLLPPLAGRVAQRAGVVGYVPQRETLDAVYPLTVAEVTHMGAYGRLRGLRLLAREERALAERCLARVGLAERSDELFASLSGGQRQRALIARALMVRPRLLVLDEPTSGIDAQTQEVVLALLLELVREEDLAVLMITHQSEMTREVDRVLWVEGGAVRDGRPAREEG